MMSELVIYKQSVVDTYLHFIKQNVILIMKLLEEKKKYSKPYDSRHKEIYFTARAIHLQIMSLIGITAEHLLKIVLLKRGFIINEGIPEAKFNDELMTHLRNAYLNKLSQEEKQELYKKVEGSIKVSFTDKLITFNTCKKLFKKSNPRDYLSKIGVCKLNPDYLGYAEITRDNCFEVLQKARNNYIHKATAHDEQNGVIWYLFNYLIWLAKKEYYEIFNDIEYIGNETVIKLFTDE